MYGNLNHVMCVFICVLYFITNDSFLYVCEYGEINELNSREIVCLNFNSIDPQEPYL